MPTPTPEDTTLTVRHGATLRERYPLLMAQPSPTIPTMREQAEARGEPVPVGKTAAEVRAAGYVVAPDIPDVATIILREPSDDPSSPINTSAVGRITDFAFDHRATDASEWLLDRPEALAAMTPEALAQAYDDMVYSLVWAMKRVDRLPAGTLFFDALASVACAIGLLEAEAHRREKLLETAAKFSLAT